MVRSMTGYGRGEVAALGLRLTAEIRSVNHRFCEISARLPRMLSAFEGEVRQLLQGRVTRGKISLVVTFGGEGSDGREPTAALRLDDRNADRYLEILSSLKRKYGLPGEVDLATFASLPNLFVWEEPEADREQHLTLLLDVVTRAADDAIGMKEREGEMLGRDLLERVRSIHDRVARIRGRAPSRVRETMEKMRERIRLLLEEGTLPEERLAQEAALLSDRLDCTEECVRLEAHCDHFRTLLREEATPGRKLNFLLQEMNREINTIGSKSSDVPIVEQVVDIKEELERIREQVQNIE
jgi:uncharacterized protein (TIGR00255 family)